MKKRIGRIHIDEGELCKLLGYEGGRIRYIGFMQEYAEIGKVIEHTEMPLTSKDNVIVQVDRSERQV